MSIFGKQCVVVAIDAKRNYDVVKGKTIFNQKDKRFWFEVRIFGGKEGTGVDAIKWAKKLRSAGPARYC